LHTSKRRELLSPADLRMNGAVIQAAIGGFDKRARKPAASSIFKYTVRRGV
jgi:hypothetical protein